jgi:SAM-dependent methyltransferase
VSAPFTATACRVCGEDALRDHAGRRFAHCASCGALERHRALVAGFARELSDGRGRRALEVGPVSPTCFKGYLTSRGWTHVSMDKWSTGNPHDRRDVRFVDFELDLVDMHPFTDATFDLVIAQHVIEEIPDYVQALDEIRRVLAPGGVALLEIPYDPGRRESSERPPNHFGNVWEFGTDLVESLAARFEQVEAHALQEYDYRGEIFACRAT